MGTGQPNAPSPFLAGIGKGRFLGSKAAVLQRFKSGSWSDVAHYRSAHDANLALDEAIGDGAEVGTLRVIDAPPSTTARVLMIAGAAAFAIVAVAIVWLFVAGG
jgi:hypothetical protein